MSVTGFMYLHENNKLIYKPSPWTDIADLLDSDLVVMFWPIDPTQRETAWDCILGATLLGGDDTQVKELAAKWGVSEEDVDTYAGFSGCEIVADGDLWMASGSKFKNLAESPAGFGGTKVAALLNLLHETKYVPQKMWGQSATSHLRSL